MHIATLLSLTQPFVSAIDSPRPSHVTIQLCASALQHMKITRHDLPVSMEEAMAMPHVVQV